MIRLEFACRRKRWTYAVWYAIQTIGKPACFNLQMLTQRWKIINRYNDEYQGPLLPTWIIFDPSIDK